MAKLRDEIDVMLRRLFPLARSITGEANRETLSALSEIAPIEIHEYPCGTPVYDWVIPDEWVVRDAWIKDAAGTKLVDFAHNNLHLMSYSEPLHERMSFAELEPHLHFNPEIPEAIPYRTSYYRRDWGFCVDLATRERLEVAPGLLEVFVDSEFNPDGSLTVGEVVLPGRGDDEILISTYFCHPSLANDNLSGAVMTAFLARELAARGPHNHGLRIVFVPETIGAIAYCAMNEAAMRRIDAGFVVSCVGGPGRYGYKQSFEAAHPINRIIERVFRRNGVDDFVTYPFDIHGSDERQYSSQGFRINTATISKDKYYEYRYYHTSRDNLELISADHVATSLGLYLDAIEELDRNLVYRATNRNCETMLSRHGMYPETGGAVLPGEHASALDMRLWLLFLCDGKVDLHTIAERIDADPSALSREAEALASHGLLERVTEAR